MSKRKNYARSVLRALQESSFSLIRVKDRVVLGLTDGHSLSIKVKNIERVVLAIGTSDGDLFSLENKSREKKFMANSIVGEIFFIETEGLSDLIKYYPFHQFSPHVSVFIKHVEAMKLGDMLRLGAFYDDVESSVSMLNECVRRIREEVNGKEFIRQVSKELRRVNKNYKELREYIDALFRSYARLMVLRIDLSYLTMFCDGAPSDDAVTYEEVKTHREMMLRDLREKLLPDSLVGYAWKLEYGLEKNFHYHLMIFLDGSKVRQDVNIAMMIGEHWRTKITRDRGNYYNCNAKRESYRFCGIGMVNHFEENKRLALYRAAMYLTKVDYYIKFVAPDGGKTFSKGNRPKPKPAGLGRPRVGGNMVHARVMS